VGNNIKKYVGILLLIMVLDLSVQYTDAVINKSQFPISKNSSALTPHVLNKSVSSANVSKIQSFSNRVTAGNPGSPVSNTNTTLKVVFDSMTVHNTHEGLFSGDGEYNIVAYVQGIKVPLTDLSKGGDKGPAFCAGFGCGVGLRDISKGETVTFKPGAEATVNLPEGVPLTVFTAGVEVDTCGWKKFPNGDDEIIVRLTEPELERNSLSEVLKHPELNWSGIILLYQHIAEEEARCLANTANNNDVIGSILAFYNPPLYGVGQHDDAPTNIDFDLRYTITIVKPPGAVLQLPSQ